MTVVESSSFACQLRVAPAAHLYGQIMANAPHAKRVVQQDSHLGQRVVICGAGPSLAVERHRLPLADEVWACNSALPYLYDRGHRVTHGFCIDQGDAMMAVAEWGRALPVQYLVASSVHPGLRRLLQQRHRHLTWFHNYLGQADPEGYVPKHPGESYEWELYTTLFPITAQVGYGLNSVQRAVCLALFMGFGEIIVAGADCAAAPDCPTMPDLPGTPAYKAWLAALPIYADGRTAAAAFGADTWFTEGVIDGRRWVTRADMVISARMMVDMVRGEPAGRIRLLGDTLPAAILPHADDPEWMERLPQLAGTGRVENFHVRLLEEAAVMQFGPSIQVQMSAQGTVTPPEAPEEAPAPEQAPAPDIVAPAEEPTPFPEN